MASRKEEERNEKIIRGLMKLPPNRRCINCDSLGPQYVCTNFWTFVCITCSGIHREFTHRVKSVSMAKFTSQEVEALQYGGNQRARETYLQDWDLQKRRLPLSSNVDKIREFIKHVYVDKKYAGGKTAEKPPRDMQNPKSREDETRRASSYHSYSQSPPYDHQYEERIYGRSSVMLTRRSGSDKGGYEGKLSSLIYSPGQMSDEGYADRFHEASVSRYSDYSVSSGGDPIRSDTQSPNYQKESGYGSPTFLATRDTLRNADGFTHRQRTASAGSFGSIDSNSPTFKSYNSGGLTDVVSEPDQGTANPQDMSIPGNSGSIDLFNRPGAPNSASSAASTVDSFQLPAAVQPSTVDLFQPSSTSSSFQRSQSSPLPSLDFFGNIVPEQSASILDDVPAESALVRNEGWATFDTPQTTLFPAAVDNFNPKQGLSYEGDSFGKFDPYSSMESSLQRTLSHNSDFPSTIPKQWHDVLPNVEASLNTTSTLIWNAFEDSTAQLPSKPVNQGSELQLPKQELSSNDQYLWAGIPENSGEDVFHNTASLVIPAGPTMPPQSFMEPSYTPWLPVMGELQPPATNCKSINPFDFPYDSDLEQSNMFPDMSSLQDSLPSAPLPSSSLGVSQPWLPQNPAPPYSPAAGQGGLTYMAGQTPSSHIPNVPTQGPVASIGGNPFD